MKLGLALGGGARGAAHIGVLLELERLSIRPALITGTSIGGMVGVLWGAGLNAFQVSTHLQQMRILQMFSLPGQQPSLSGHRKIERLLIQAIGRITFADLDLPVSVVATDLISRQSIVLNEGDVLPAILATIAMPTLLPAVALGPWHLVDGGLLNNTPYDVAYDQGATHVIAVDLTNSAPYTPPTNTSLFSRLGQSMRAPQTDPLWQLATVIFDIVTESSLNARIDDAPPDLLIRPYLGTLGYLDFARWDEGVEAGRRAARAVVDELEAFVK